MGSQEYVCDTSHMGLSDEEKQALFAWISWISREWKCYHKRFPRDDYNADFEIFESLFQREELQSPQAQGRWASIARRSRWPLLRNVVAETYRCVLEPQELDRLPLPNSHADLFELLCLVRMLSALEPQPQDIRWLDREMNRNEIELPGLQCRYHHSFDKKKVISTTEFEGGLKAAMLSFGVRIPHKADILLTFDEPRNGFDGILLEIKSGKQSYFDSLLQLKAYRAVLPRQRNQRYLIWGIVERPPGGRVSLEQIERLERERGVGEDLWVFSGASDIPTIMEVVELSLNLA